MMDSAAGEVQLLTRISILQESIRISKSSPKTFILIALTLVLPLCVAILTLTSFSLDPELDIIQVPDNVHTFGTWTKLVLLQFVFPIAIFVFSLLSTAAVVFTVASLYTFRNVSFINILPAIPRIFGRLFITFLFISILVILYQVVSFGCMVALSKFPNLVNNLALLVMAESFLSILFYGIHSYLFVIWHLASVISVLEPVYGFAAMKRSKELLKGRTWMAIEFGYDYLCVFLLIKTAFCYLVLRVQAKLLLALVDCLLLGVLVIVTSIGLLVQTVFYYACKSFHHQEIDNNALSQLLDGYLSDQYVPLISNIEMQELEI
ncbi:polyadenylate-binding protein 1-B-binding protein [Thalictrum thalictroides]|uniref:Polyadenylate-binding protein 1-B-binding protein n=1 Tax=Thalictrum thalictroides TaxID=46969 RepID=A0A7J6VEJ7_THATH|nr:polyadenylate-binding protein 1-B-binding protein [Thalictrum thalictroides]